MQNDLYDRDFFTFIRATEDVNVSTDQKIAALKSHLKQYTPAWAEKISGVSASKIESLAKEFAKTKPAVVISYRGAVAHYNGNETERACQMLAAITGNIDNPGGRCRAVGPKWKYPKGPKPKDKPKGLDLSHGFPGAVSYPSHGVCQQVLPMIKDGKAGRPDVYMWYCYNPVYVCGDNQGNIDVMKDEKMLPFTVTSNIVYDEGSKLADMILPDTTYLERWDWDDMVDPNQIGEHYIRQPLVKPLGEARNLADVCCDLAARMGFPLGFDTMEEFVKISHDMTEKEVKGFPGYEYMKQHGVWHDPGAKPKYYGYKKEVKAADLEGAVLDEATGVYWKGKAGEDYTTTKGSAEKYVGQKIGDKVYAAFKPDKLSKSGYLELYSVLLKMKGHAPLPTYVPIPEHENMKPDELVLTTYKVAVHIHSRSTHRKWLAELYHDNPGWINSKTAAALGIKDGDRIKVKSSIGEIVTTANVNEKIVPGTIAISMHVGREESGRYGSGKKSPMGHDNDPDLKNMWWDKHGAHPNWIIPNWVDPINGQQRWMDTVVES
jgi:anaerobic selenocysteine-containing dehydrogenase